jgi:saccharopine dehydrogenase-like NADP-dependent oxidoreductase
LAKVRDLDYKTIRYAGHCDKFKTMIDLGLCSSDEVVVDFQNVTPRKVFAKLLEENLPADGPDYVLVRLEFTGTPKPGRAEIRGADSASAFRIPHCSGMTSSTALTPSPASPP